MLIQFRFQNFKSFRDDSIFDLSAIDTTKHLGHVIHQGYEKLLPIAAIYGANASGKSNFIEAFHFMTQYVIESFAYGGEGKSEKNAIPYTPFLFDSTSSDAVSSFEVYFTNIENEKYCSYNYGFTLNRNGIMEEWLNSKDETTEDYSNIFYRGDSREFLELSNIPLKSQENIKIALEKETLIVSLGAKLKIAQLKTVRDWFNNVNFADASNTVENFRLTVNTPNKFSEDTAVQNKVISYLSTFDSSIVGFKVEDAGKSKDGKELLNIYAIHATKDGKTVQIPLQEESGGTLKMFALYPDLLDTLEKGSILFVDELNSRLHPLLVRSILITFLDPKINSNHAQLVFTTHDAWQLSDCLLRRDEIWLIDKNNEGVSSLYSLADFEEEKGEDSRRDEDYLLGKYGAIPTLKPLFSQKVG